MLSAKQLRQMQRAIRQGVEAGADLPVEEIERALLAHEAESLAKDLHAFTQEAWHVVEPDRKFIDGWHIRAICEHLEAVVRGEISNLVINVPPGCCKSLLTCVFLPAWTWTHKPSFRFFYASYEQGLSTRDSLRTRQILQSQWYQQRWGGVFSLVGDSNEKTRFDNDKRGWRIATSVGGRGLGEHPSILICDDPLKIQEAHSEAERQNVIRWWDGTVAARGKIKGVDVRRIVIMQRLHEDDLSGHILQKDADFGEWDHLVLPMRCEPGRMQPTSIGWTDPREDGELLWPEAFPEQKVQSLERDLGSLMGAGQLQQRPVPLGGQMFHREWFGFVDAVPKQAHRVRYWDKAGTDDSGAYTVGVLMALDDNLFYVEDVRRAQLSPAKRNKLIKATAEMDKLKYRNTVEVWVEQEPGSSGKFDALHSVSELAGVPCYIDKVTGSKEVRAAPFASQCEVGNVLLLRASWNEAYLDELQSFPTGKYKDQVDASSGAFNRLATGRDYWDDYEGVASGEDPRDERRPITDEELNDPDFPPFLKDFVEGARDIARDRAEFDADERFDSGAHRDYY